MHTGSSWGNLGERDHWECHGVDGRIIQGRVSPTETLFPILLLESVVNFSGRDVSSNEEFDHNALFHAPRYLLSHSYCAVRLVYIQISPGHI